MLGYLGLIEMKRIAWLIMGIILVALFNMGCDIPKTRRCKASHKEGGALVCDSWEQRSCSKYPIEKVNGDRVWYCDGWAVHEYKLEED
jgi:hypothetical protein